MSEETTPKHKITAAPGIYLVRPLEEKFSVKTETDKDKKKSILLGQIIDVGANRDHDDGGKMISTYKKGDVIWFFSYVDGADEFTYEKTKYFVVLFHDARAKRE